MASVVQIQSPVQDNPMLTIQQIANNMQNLRANSQKMELAKQMAPLIQAQTQAQTNLLNQKTAAGQATLPYAASLAASNAAIKNYIAGHPSINYSSAAQQAYAAQEAKEQGNPQIADAINAALQAKTASSQQTGDYRQALADTIRSGTRDLGQKLKQTTFATLDPTSKLWGNVAPEDRATVQRAAQINVARSLMTPSTINQGTYLQSAGDLFNKSNATLGKILTESPQNGLVQYANLTLAKAESTVGKNSPLYNDLKSFEMEQKAMSNEIGRLMNDPNVEQAVKDRAKLFDINWKNMTIGGIIQARQTIADILKGQEERLNALTSLNRLKEPNPLEQHVNLTTVPANLGGQSSISSHNIKVKSPNGSMHIIPASQLNYFKSLGFSEAQ